MNHYYKEIIGATAFSTTRHGGVSVGAYASFNANHYCGDDPKCVETNRSLLCRELGIDLVSMKANDVVIPALFSAVTTSDILSVPCIVIVPWSVTI